jgi:hypothetical protein
MIWLHMHTYTSYDMVGFLSVYTVHLFVYVCMHVNVLSVAVQCTDMKNLYEDVHICTEVNVNKHATAILKIIDVRYRDSNGFPVVNWY